MAYKHIIKVSNVCQLLDKSIYPATTTNKGITITNNEDGSLTLNGTATSDGEFYSLQYINLINGHKYFIYDNQGGSFANIVFTLDALGSADSREGNIFTCNITSGPLRRNAYFYVMTGTVISNRVYKPQIFDLTEMYGAGNEPTTVEQFRADFPNELYPYTPRINLSSNKRMIKVSDVCQLYAKNIWQEYIDLYGVSIKNNNDGSITLNGTATEAFFYTSRLDYEIKPNHKYLYFDHYPQTPSWKSYIGGCEGKVNHESMVTFAVYSLNKDGTIDSSSPNLPSNTLLNTFCMVYKGFTLNNITIKPQLFDLTEMYGAGHEPATVAEFKQRFPNEYYPYFPQCWLTSYKSAVVCKTKNLFDVNNAVPYDFSTDNPDSNLVWLKDGIYTTRMNNYNLGSGLRIKNGLSLPAGTYTVSVKIVDFNNVENFNIGFMYKNAAGKWDAVNRFYNSSEVGIGDIISFVYLIPEHTDLRLYLNYQNDNGQYLTGYVSYKDIQLEQGPTATSYVPYQHL